MTDVMAPETGAGSPPRADPARRRLVLRFLAKAGPLTALVALLVFFGATSPAFSRPANVGTLLSQAAILLVIGIGLTFVILLGGIDLSVEGVMTTSSLVFVLLASNDRNGLNLGPLAVLGGIAAGSLLGVINGILHVKMRIPSFMVTLGMGAVGLGIATVLFGGRAPRLLDTQLRSIGVGTTFGISNLVFISALVLLLGWGIQRYSRAGRYFFVIGSDEAVARVSGIDTGRYKILAFAISGTTTGIAGVMAAMQLGVGDTAVGSGYLFTAITAVVVGGTLLIGGRGGVIQTLIGVAIVIVLANGLILIGVDPYVQTAVQGTVIVLAVIGSSWSLRRRTRVVK